VSGVRADVWTNVRDGSQADPATQGNAKLLVGMIKTDDLLSGYPFIGY